MLTTKDIVAASLVVVNKYGLDLKQYDQYLNSSQLDNILAAAHVGRWDQVTILLIQEKVIEKWPS